MRGALVTYTWMLLQSYIYSSVFLFIALIRKNSLSLRLLILYHFNLFSPPIILMASHNGFLMFLCVSVKNALKVEVKFEHCVCEGGRSLSGRFPRQQLTDNPSRTGVARRQAVNYHGTQYRHVMLNILQTFIQGIFHPLSHPPPPPDKPTCAGCVSCQVCLQN